MTHIRTLTFALACTALPLRAQGTAGVPLIRGMVVTTSTKIVPGTYRLPGAPSLERALIVIRGSNITLDLTGVTIEGSDATTDPDRATGVAIRVDSGANVAIKGGAIRGYRFGIMARGTKDITIDGIDLSYGWKPRLYSLVEHESLADWLSFHQNDKGEWLRFGAAIYLDGVSGGEIVRNRAEQGMNGLMLVRCTGLRVHDNTFQFNSGLGIALYRSSDNSILRNRLDFNVRGYSQGFYRRGQDSADLLLYEQSSRNVVAYNSATHGGDGLFLWAGQSTMDTGEGGANDNLFFGNDFSYAPTNAMEATFSRNLFIANRAMGSDYGLWGGYSFESKVVGNCFARNRIGVAIEHGQDNDIVSNSFNGEQNAVRLWANRVEPGDWGYPKRRDTRSRNVRIADNMFARHRVAVYATDTRDVTVEGNRIAGADTVAFFRDTAAVRVGANAVSPRADSVRGDPCATMPALPAEFARLAPQTGNIPRSIPTSALAARDRSAIIVDEWGPFDWRSPKLWPIDSTRAVPLRLAVVGPDGAWRVVSTRGVAGVSKRAGRMNDTITVTPSPDAKRDWSVMLEYTGAAMTTPRGTRHAAGAPVPFGYEWFEPEQQWDVKLVAWTDASDPRTTRAALDSLLAATPVVSMRAPRLDYMWFRPTIAGVPQARWALDARSTLTLAPGAAYALRAISDDGVRVWVDGALVIDNWMPHESAVDTAPIAPGRHEIRVQYYQVDGWTELRLDVVRGTR